jgi:hypothetical protein
MMKNKRLTILPALCLGVFLSVTAFGQDNSEEVLKKLQEIDKMAQQTIDMQDIENLMNINALQIKGAVKPGDADYRETVSQKAKDVCYGLDDKYLYGDAARKALHGQDDPAFGKAGTLKVYFVSTGYVQIAEDGQTAKGIYYSPGLQTEMGTDGQPKSAWDYKAYGVDFIKEDGKWKIWHFAAYTDFVTPPNVSWTEKTSISNTNIKYQAWTPSTGATSKLKSPSPYKTFNKTFSYCPAEGK